MFGAICELGRVAAVYFNVCAIIFLQGGALTVPLSKSNQQKPSANKIKTQEAEQIASDIGHSTTPQSPCAADRHVEFASKDGLKGSTRSGACDSPEKSGDRGQSKSKDSESTSSAQIVFLWDRVVKQSDQGGTVSSYKPEAFFEAYEAIAKRQLASQRPAADPAFIPYWMDIQLLPPSHGPPSIQLS